MKHSFIAENFGVRLRPVRLEDAEFIVWLRHLNHARGKLGDSVSDTASQKAWLEEYFKREGDYYCVIETADSIPLGTIGVYNISGGSGECGRYVTRPGVPAAVPALVLGADMAFDKIGLKQLRATAVATNRLIRSIMEKVGFREVGVKPAGRSIGGCPVDMVHLVATRSDWLRNRERIVKLSERAAKQIERWRREQSSPENWRETRLQSAA